MSAELQVYFLLCGSTGLEASVQLTGHEVRQANGTQKSHKRQEGEGDRQKIVKSTSRWMIFVYDDKITRKRVGWGGDGDDDSKRVWMRSRMAAERA